MEQTSPTGNRLQRRSIRNADREDMKRGKKTKNMSIGHTQRFNMRKDCWNV